MRASLRAFAAMSAVLDLREPRALAMRAPAPSQDVLTRQDVERIEAAKAKRARRASKRRLTPPAQSVAE